MKFNSFLASLLIAAPCYGQLTTEPVPNISIVSPGFNLDWHGQLNRGYFIQWSDDLINWSYMPVIEHGADAALGYGFSSPDDRIFLRLKYTEDAVTDPINDDYDGDGISNWDEVRAGGSGTDPFKWDTDGDGKSDYYADSNGNGMPDGWESANGNVGDLAPDGNDDDDTLTNLEESLMGSNPLSGDTDGDSIKDDAECIWWDNRVQWPRTPVRDYVVVELDGLTLSASSYGSGISSDTAIQDSFSRDTWSIQSLSNGGHVLVVEDQRGTFGNYSMLNPSSIPGSVKNHVWAPNTGNWVTLKNDKAGTGTQGALGVARSVSKDGKVAGFAWVPLGVNTTEGLVPTGGPGVERAVIRWDTINATGVPSLISSLTHTPISDFSSDNDALELPPNALQVLGISNSNNILHAILSNGQQELKLGGTGIATNSSGGNDLSTATMTADEDIFYPDPTSGDIQFKPSGGAATPVSDGNEKPYSINAAARVSITQDSTDMIGLASALWVKDGSWKKIKEHRGTKAYVSGKGVSSDGTILQWAGNSISRNGKTEYIKDLVDGNEWSDFKMEKINDHGAMTGRATKGSDEKVVILLPVEIKEVNFSLSNELPTLTDDSNVKRYTAPQWLDNNSDGDSFDESYGDKNYPVAYVKKTKPKIGAVFNIKNMPKHLTVMVRATGSDGIKIPETAAIRNGDEVTLTLTESSTTWPDTIKYYDEKDANKAFTINWEIKIGDSSWSNIASTRHRVYLTLGASKTVWGMESLFYLGCKNAEGLADATQARFSIYSEFTDQEVTRMDNKTMTYYKDGNEGATNMLSLLETKGSNDNGNGNCYAWAELFQNILLTQGIDAEKAIVTPKQIANEHGNYDKYLVVNNVSYTTDFITNGTPGHSYRADNDPVNLGDEVVALDGIPGQGNVKKPRKLFTNHCLIKSGNLYFDPSYGTGSYVGIRWYEDDAFGGYAKDGFTSNTIHVRKNNTDADSGTEIDISK